MLTWEDCVALCALNEAEIDAIAEHEHIPEVPALLLGDYLCHTPTGERAIRRIILDDISAARQRGDLRHVLALLRTLQHFVATHPKARETAGGATVSREV
jgi:hypothetical protein